MSNRTLLLSLSLSLSLVILSASCGTGEVDVYSAGVGETSMSDVGATDMRGSDHEGSDHDAMGGSLRDDGGAGDDVNVSVAPDVNEVPDLDEGEPCPNVRITAAPGARLNVRPMPNTSQPPVGALYYGMVAQLKAEVVGETIEGNDVWYEVEALDTSGYISAVYAECTTDDVTELTAPDGFYLPLECDVSARISQGNDGSFSHSGLARYAWDFSVGLGTPLTAIADGVVIQRYAGTAPGSACDGGGQSCVLYANHAVLLHGDNTTSTYRHLSQVKVEIGDFVPRGVAVGLSGQTGWSTGPHAHVQRMTNCGSQFPPAESVCQSIPTSFADVAVNGGVPRTGDTVKSGNCIPLR